MKSAVVGIIFGLAFGLLVVTGSCSVNHRSGDFTCTKQADCAGRSPNTQCDLTTGFCIVPGSIDAPRPIDAPKGDGGACPAACTTCNVALKTCTIDCSVGNTCNGLVTCPPGYHCDIQCKTQNSCRNGVDCQGGLSCTVECSGQSACQDVQCGNGPCDVSCSGPSSCRNVACDASCACDVTCTGILSCGSTVTCTSGACRNGSGCTSVPLTCHSCM